MTTPQELKAITKRFATEPWAKGDFAVFDEVCAPSYTLGDGATLEDLKKGIREYRKALPDLTDEVGEIIVEGDTVAYRWTMRGTHRGEFHGIAPTGKPVLLTGITILHFANGKIIRDEFESGSPPLEAQVAGKHA